MLPPKNRLTKKSNFEKVKSEGKMFQSASFGLLVLERNDQTYSRFGFVVSTKVSKSAVKRNKIKRYFRLAVNDLLESVKDGFDFIFLVKKDALGTKQDKLSKEIEIAFSKIEAI